MLRPSRLIALASAALLGLNAAGQQPPALPAINPAAARLEATVGGLDGPGYGVAVGEESGLVVAACEGQTLQYWRKDVQLGVRAADMPGNAVKAHAGPVTAVVHAGTAFA